MAPDRVWVVVELIEYMSTHETWINDPTLRQVADTGPLNEKLNQVVGDLKDKRCQLQVLEQGIFDLERDKFQMEETVREQRILNERHLVNLLKQKLARDEQIQMDLEARVVEQSTEIERLTKLLDERVRSKDDVYRTETTLRSEIKRHEEVLVQNETRCRELENQYRMDVEQLQQKVIAAEATVTKLRECERSVRAENEQLRERSINHEQALLAVQESEAVARREVDQQRARLALDDQDMRQARDSERQLRTEVQQLRERRSVDEEDIRRLQEVERSLRLEVIQGRERTVNDDLEIRRLREVEKVMQMEVEHLRGETSILADSDRRRSDLLRDNEGKWMLEVDRLKAELRAVMERGHADHAEGTRLCDELVRARDETARLRDQVAVLQDSERGFQLQLDKMRALASADERDVQVLRDAEIALRDQNETLLNENKQLREVRDRSPTAGTSNKDEMAAWRDAERALRSENHRLLEEVTRLRSELSRLREELHTVEQERGEPHQIGKDPYPIVGIELSEGQTYGIDGVCVIAVKDGGPASVAGIVEGDIITSFHGTTIVTREDFKRAVRGGHPGETTSFILQRGQHPHRHKLMGHIVLAGAPAFPDSRRTIVRRLTPDTTNPRHGASSPHTARAASPKHHPTTPRASV